MPDQSHSNYLLSPKKKTKSSAWMATFCVDRLSIVCGGRGGVGWGIRNQPEILNLPV